MNTSRARAGKGAEGDNRRVGALRGRRSQLDHHLAWTQPLANNYWNMMASRYVQGEAGARRCRLRPQPSARETDQYLTRNCVDLAGNVHALWRRKISAAGNTFGVFARRYCGLCRLAGEQMLASGTGWPRSTLIWRSRRRQGRRHVYYGIRLERDAEASTSTWRSFARSLSARAPESVPPRPLRQRTLTPSRL